MQGVGAAIWRSIFRDGFKDEEMAQYGGYLALFFLLVLPLAPIVGSALSPISWRLIFVVLMMYNFISLGLVLFILMRPTVIVMSVVGALNSSVRLIKGSWLIKSSWAFVLVFSSPMGLSFRGLL